MPHRSQVAALSFGVLFMCGLTTQAVTMDMVTVGDPGNVGEWSGENYGGWGGVDRICGAVGYTYNIGKYEVTNSQYAEFLNAVATVDDPNCLYNANMGGGWNDIGGISRTGAGTQAAPWEYSVRSHRGNRPVNYVSWHDGLRFSNWMHNGQPTGPQDTSTTENGAYDMSSGISVVRKPVATWVIPSEDEWYKAAYYKGGGTNAGYWDYPTESDTAPTAEAAPGTDLANGSANYTTGTASVPIYADPTYYTTEVGAYNTQSAGNYVSDSAYGTFDQGGNVWEWNDSMIDSWRGFRGGSFTFYDDGYLFLLAATRTYGSGSSERPDTGFRVAMVPEPGTLSLLALASLALLRRWR